MKDATKNALKEKITSIEAKIKELVSVAGQYEMRAKTIRQEEIPELMKERDEISSDLESEYTYP